MPEDVTVFEVRRDGQRAMVFDLTLGAGAATATTRPLESAIPMSSLAAITKRRAMNLGSSPA
jgi:hypothetical protein